MDAGDSVARGAGYSAVRLERSEPAAEQNIAVRLEHHGAHKAIRRGIETGIHRAVGIEPRDVLPQDGW